MRIHRVLVVAFLVTFARVASAQVEPGLGPLPDGNLRVDLRCADYWATPANGLQVSVDGVAPPTTGTNGANVLVDGKHGPYEMWVADRYRVRRAARRAPPAPRPRPAARAWSATS